VPEVRVLRRIADELARASGEGLGPDEPTALWAAVAGVKPAEVWLLREREPAPDVVKRFWQAVAQRKRGVPFAYAVGRVGFRTLELAIDRRALIPRPETEGLVELVLARCATGRVADIGTGCGCIALALAVEGQFDEVVAVEQSGGAAALARENVTRLAPATPVEIREGNLLAPLVDAGKRYRVIVSNPPYLTEREYAELDASVREFEPREALVSGADGLEATHELFATAAALLEPGGLLALEIDERRDDAIRSLARAHGWRNVEVHADLFGCPRYVVATPGHDPGANWED
jgi:release factor glutamine methyltransferase